MRSGYRRSTVLMFVACCVVAPGSAFAASEERIVVLNDSANPEKVAQDFGLTPKFVYRYALRGFAAKIGDKRAAELEADRRVQFVAEDQIRPAALPAGSQQRSESDLRDIPQVIPFGIERVGALASRTAKINGRGDPLDVDIAVMDTGVESTNSDLRVVGGYDCTPRGRRGSEPTDTEDPNGHGTHVAGIAAARDNAFGVVGVAPGARIWPIRVLGKDGIGNDSWIVCGIDWATKNAGKIDVANVSLGDFGGDDGACGTTDEDPMHYAICNSVAAGITYSVSAGNDSADAGSQVPASYPEVLAVSSMGDTDGLKGGQGPASCEGTPDDGLSVFSNFGAVVDIAAPGDCVVSTYPGNQLWRMSGTSMAAPHVAGAAALWRVGHPNATPAQVRAAVRGAREHWSMPGDPDGIDEGVLDVATF
jgi:subtilisin family serine protease